MASEQPLDRSACISDENLKLRRKQGQILLKRKLPSNADHRTRVEAHKETEAYLRETLRLWEERERLSTPAQKGTATASLELATCLAKQVWNNKKREKIIDAATTREIGKLIGPVELYLRRSKNIEERDKEILLSRARDIVQHISKGLRSDEEETEQLYTRVIGIFKDFSEGRFQKEQASYRYELARTLFAREKYDEAITDMEAITHEYKEEFWPEEPEKYRACIESWKKRKRDKERVPLACAAAACMLEEQRARCTKWWQRALTYAKLVANIKIRWRRLEANNERRRKARFRWSVVVRVVRFHVAMISHGRQIAAKRRRARPRWCKAIYTIWFITAHAKRLRDDQSKVESDKPVTSGTAGWILECLRTWLSGRHSHDPVAKETSTNPLPPVTYEKIVAHAVTSLDNQSDIEPDEENALFSAEDSRN